MLYSLEHVKKAYEVLTSSTCLSVSVLSAEGVSFFKIPFWVLLKKSIYEHIYIFRSRITDYFLHAAHKLFINILAIS